MSDVTTLPPASPTPAPPPGTVTAQMERPLVTARLGALFRLFYVNLILTILTLGIYRFWAKTNMRRYVWRNVQVGGEVFEYTGTGKELLIGFLKAMLVLLPPLILIAIVQMLLPSPYDSVVVMIQYAAIAVVFAAGTYAARRYRMSRTTWSGIRLHQAGSPWRYAWLYVKGSILSAITLGLYLPWFRTQITAYETANLHLGSEPFRFTGTGRGLFKRWLVVWILTAVSLGLALLAMLALVWQLAAWLTTEANANTDYVWALAPMGAVLLASPILLLAFLWYRAGELRYYAAQTTLAGVRFGMVVRGRDLFVFYLVNILIIAGSLGILFPIVIRRRVTFWTRWLLLDGTLDLAAIRQTDRGPRTGEGLANFFDMDFLGV